MHLEIPPKAGVMFFCLVLKLTTLSMSFTMLDGVKSELQGNSLIGRKFVSAFIRCHSFSLSLSLSLSLFRDSSTSSTGNTTDRDVCLRIFG